ncbi:MAG TPA: hypothetical protein VH306_05315 [Gaiellaceae bacterium]
MEPPDDAGSGRADPEPEPMTGSAPSGVELQIGPRVTAVFTAAEKAAQHIVTMAREEAEDVRRRAEAEAEALLTQRRYQAEEEAARIVAEARMQADQIQATAEEEARQIEETARRRELRIREESRLLAERIEWARDGLRDVGERLREAEVQVTLPLPPSAPDAPPTRRDARPDSAASGIAEPAGVEPGDEVVEPPAAGPDESTDEHNRPE